MRNHSYATFAYLKDKDFLVFKFFEIAYTRFCHLFFKSVYSLLDNGESLRDLTLLFETC